MSDSVPLALDLSSLSTALFAVIPVMMIVLLNGIFVAAEFAIVRTHITRLKGPEFKNRWGTPAALKLIDNLDLSLSSTQLGITIMSLLLGWMGEPIFQRIVIGAVSWMGPETALFVSHTIATTLALLIVMSLHVIIGELVAKSVAVRYPEATLVILGPPTLLFSTICRPIIFILNAAAGLVLRLIGIAPATSTERVHTSGELAMLVSHSRQQGALDKEEEKMLHGVFGFSETIAREVMTPRTDLVTIAHDASIPEILKIIKESGFSRFPVVGENVDDVIGILLAKDLLSQITPANDGKQLQVPTFKIEKILREPFFVPGTKSISELMNELKRRKLHMALVLDEHGGIDGAVTLEDLIEEIVGDILDESDVPERDIVQLESGDALIDGGVLVADINRRFDLEIPEGDYDTIAGYILSFLGRIPTVEDEIEVPCNLHEIDNLDAADAEANRISPVLHAYLRVEKVVGRRIEQIRLIRSRGSVLETAVNQN